MKAKFIASLWLGVITAGLILISAFDTKTAIHENHHELSVNDDKLKKDAFKVLDMKCIVCHPKQNPFMIFKGKNISKRAKKLYQMVSSNERCPKEMRSD